MAGSDRVPDPNDSKRAQVGTRKPSTRAKWRSSLSAYRSVLEHVLDTADIVRDGDVSTVAIKRLLGNRYVLVQRRPNLVQLLSGNGSLGKDVKASWGRVEENLVPTFGPSDVVLPLDVAGTTVPSPMCSRGV